MEAKFEQAFGEAREVVAVAFGKGDAAVGESLAGCHATRHGIGIGHHEQAVGLGSGSRRAAGRQPPQHFGAQDFVGGIALGVFHGTAIGGGIEKYLVVGQHTGEVVIEVTGPFFILQHDEAGAALPAHTQGPGGKDHGGGGSVQAFHINGVGGGFGCQLTQSRNLRMAGVRLE